jgi:N4-gp56 family major capsid protein
MANELAPFTPVKYSLKLVELLYNDTLYPFITNTMYEGQIKDSGDRVRVRTAAKIVLSTYEKGTTLVAQDLNPTEEDLIIDQLHYFKFVVDDVDKIQNDIDTINEYAMNTKNDMAQLIDTDLLSYMRKNVDGENVVGTAYTTTGMDDKSIKVAATTGVVTGSGTTFTAAMVGGYFKWTGSESYYLVTAYSSATSITIKDLDGIAYTGGVETNSLFTINAATATAITKNNVYAQIVALRTALGQKLTPKEGRFMVVNSHFEGLLMQAPEFIPAVQSAYQNVVEKGLIGSIAGFKVYTSELVDGDNTTGYWFVAGTREYCAFAAQIMKTSMIPSAQSENTFVSTCKGLLVYGRKVFEGNRGRGAVLRATLA